MPINANSSCIQGSYVKEVVNLSLLEIYCVLWRITPMKYYIRLYFKKYFYRNTKSIVRMNVLYGYCWIGASNEMFKKKFSFVLVS